jgi:nitroreductase
VATSAAQPRFVPLEFVRQEPQRMLERARALRVEMGRRRSVRHFSDEPIPEGLLDEVVALAGSAPSGAHRQPWTFVVVTDAALKARIRAAAEEEERKLYRERISAEWRAALRPLGTDEHKPFLETAPALIAVFRQVWGLENGVKSTNYYTQESVGIAVGFLLMALHQVGLASLTHTPSPMGFLGQILGRPENERPYLLVPVGYPEPGCLVPDLARKPLDRIRVRR